MSKDLIKKLSELDGEVLELKISLPEVKSATSIQQPLELVEFYYAPPLDKELK